MPYIPEKFIESKSDIIIGYGASNGQALVTCNIRIPLVLSKMLEGKNLIECIDAEALPDWRARL